MTEYQLKRRAVTNFKNFQVDKHVQRNYQQQWLKCIKLLGDKWVLAETPQPRSYLVRS